MPIIEIATAFLLQTAKDSLHDWAKKEGVGLLDGLVKQQSFNLFGKRRAVINDLWESISSQVRQPSLIAAINLEAEEYRKLPGLLCEHSENLPSQPGPYPQRPVKALPRRAVNEAAMARLKNGVGKAQLLQDQTQSDILLNYFLTDIVREFDRQYSKVYDNKSPLKIGEARETAGSWVALGLDNAYPWPTTRTPGHYLVYNDDHTSFEKLGRDEKRRVEKQLTDLEAKLGGLDPQDKDTLVNSIVFRTASKYSSSPHQWKIV
jgi:hypothetical protein